jgi:hypothetical protein
MKTVNSLSGGKTSSYIAANYPADYNVFALVRVEDKKCLFPDKKIRQEVEDRIQAPFVGTVEEDTIIYTMLDLEQFIGSKIDWVTGKTFEEITTTKSNEVYLPNIHARFCTGHLKLDPIKEWWYDNLREPHEQRIGFRVNETRRAKKMLERTSADGFEYQKFITGRKNDRNKWTELKYRRPSFPLIDDKIRKDKIEEYWLDKPVRFAYMNNCVGCFHRSPLVLKKMSQKEPTKFEWFAERERKAYNGFKKDLTYDEISNAETQIDLLDDFFNECDSGYCGL